MYNRVLLFGAAAGLAVAGLGLKTEVAVFVGVTLATWCMLKLAQRALVGAVR